MIVRLPMTNARSGSRAFCLVSNSAYSHLSLAYGHNSAAPKRVGVSPSAHTASVLHSQVQQRSFAYKSQHSGPTWVSIPASEVAAVTGRNQFKQPSEVFNQLWKRYSPKTFTGETSVDRQLAAFQRISKEEQSVVTAAAEFNATDAEDAKRTLNNAVGIINSSSSIDEDDKEKVLGMLHEQVFTAHGTRTEDKVVQHVEEKEEVSMARDNQLYSLPLGSIDGTEYVVRGKIDRIIVEEGEIVLVEVKSRMNKLFREVREYEYIQVRVK